MIKGYFPETRVVVKNVFNWRVPPNHQRNLILFLRSNMIERTIHNLQCTKCRGIKCQCSFEETIRVQLKNYLNPYPSFRRGLDVEKGFWEKGDEENASRLIKLANIMIVSKIRVYEWKVKISKMKPTTQELVTINIVTKEKKSTKMIFTCVDERGRNKYQVFIDSVEEQYESAVRTFGEICNKWLLDIDKKQSEALVQFPNLVDMDKCNTPQLEMKNELLDKHTFRSAFRNIVIDSFLRRAKRNFPPYLKDDRNSENDEALLNVWNERKKLRYEMLRDVKEHILKWINKLLFVRDTKIRMHIEKAEKTRAENESARQARMNVQIMRENMRRNIKAVLEEASDTTFMERIRAIERENTRLKEEMLLLQHNQQQYQQPTAPVQQEGKKQQSRPNSRQRSEGDDSSRTVTPPNQRGQVQPPAEVPRKGVLQPPAPLIPHQNFQPESYVSEVQLMKHIDELELGNIARVAVNKPKITKQEWLNTLPSEVANYIRDNPEKLSGYINFSQMYTRIEVPTSTLAPLQQVGEVLQELRNPLL